MLNLTFDITQKSIAFNDIFKVIQNSKAGKALAKKARWARHFEILNLSPDETLLRTQKLFGPSGSALLHLYATYKIAQNVTHFEVDSLSILEQNVIKVTALVHDLAEVDLPDIAQPLATHATEIKEIEILTSKFLPNLNLDLVNEFNLNKSEILELEKIEQKIAEVLDKSNPGELSKLFTAIEFIGYTEDAIHAWKLIETDDLEDIEKFVARRALFGILGTVFGELIDFAYVYAGVKDFLCENKDFPG